jgi:cytochrome c oxidase subunit 3
MASEVGEQAAVQRRSLSLGMTGMYIFLLSEVMFFAALFGAYFYLHAASSVWPPPGTERIPLIPIPLINSVVLFTSGGTMHVSHLYIQKGDRKKFIIYLVITIILGTMFVLGQAYEYTHAHMVLTTNKFSNAFFIMTGFHGLHVTGGIIFLLIVLIRALRGDFNSKNHLAVQTAAIYWHFVDLVWVFLLLALYIFSG